MQIANRDLTPILFAGVIFCITVLIVLIGVTVDKSGVYNLNDEFPWMIATTFLLLFAVANSMMVLKSKTNIKRHWNQSMIGFIGLATANALFATAMSGLSIGEAGSYKFLFLVVSISFLVFISILNLMRKMVDFAQREEWTQPRKRR